MIDNWWPPGQVRFTSEQVKWLITFLDLMKEGSYLPENRETGYSGGGSRRVNVHANFEMAIMIHAELTYRLDKTGKDGEKLSYQVQHELPLDYDAKSALRYCSGNGRKIISYEDYCFWVDVRNQIQRRQREYYRLKKSLT